MAHTLKMVANAAWSGFCDSHSVTEQCTYSQWALSSAPIYNGLWAVHLYTMDRQCICTVDNVGTMLTISLTHNTAECAGSTYTVHLFKARVREERVTSAG